MPAPLAATLGWNGIAPSWSTVLGQAADTGVWTRVGHANWGNFKLGKTSPLAATSGLMALVASFAASSGHWSGLRLSRVS
jgi:Ca-activated chloride channel homolog